MFFDAVARLGSIVDAARELEFNRATRSMWVQEDGRIPGSAYSAERKTEFFELLDRTNDVAEAAKSLGIDVKTAVH